MRDDFDNKTALWHLLDDDTAAGRQRKASRGSRPKPRPNEERSALAEDLYQPENDYAFTYQAARHEKLWLEQALRAFYDDNLITDVLHVVKGGKEANVYCCQAHPNLGLDLLAVKVYRPRLLRNLKNDALYKEGRMVKDEEGKEVRDARAHRAIQKKTRFGMELSFTSWIEYEFQTLQVLHAAGADVPRPVAQMGNSILMEYIGEQHLPAPTLHSVHLPVRQAAALFERLVHNVRLMLAHNRIHADLSAYNVLYWDGQVILIDFPQVVDPLSNPHGFQLLQRDLERLCQHFVKYRVKADPNALAAEMWGDYMRRDFSRLL